MKKGFLLIGLSVSMMMMFATGIVCAAESPAGKDAAPGKEKKAETAGEKKNTSSGGTIVYKPPMRGKPGNRIGGGTRGVDAASKPFLVAIVPNHTAMTLREQPVLYWFGKNIGGFTVEFTITSDESINPVIAVRLDPGKKDGLHAVRLADYGVKLKPGVEYQWFVSAVVDSKQRSRDIIAGGVLVRAESDPKLQETLKNTPAEEIPAILAGTGIWYDAFSSLTGLIEEQPGRTVFREQRISLLDQAGLPVVATSERKQIGTQEGPAK